MGAEQAVDAAEQVRIAGARPGQVCGARGFVLDSKSFKEQGFFGGHEV